MLFYAADRSSLYLYYIAQTAADYATIDEKIYKNVNYDTPWSIKCDEWKKKDYFVNFNYEVMKGRNECIFVLGFHGGKKSAEFLKELDTYIAGGNFGGDRLPQIEYASLDMLIDY
jgi:hypothetical protein